MTPVELFEYSFALSTGIGMGVVICLLVFLFFKSLAE